MFADRATIIIRSGKGGNGHVSFRRELYVPDGGPDGGDGGKGGDIIFVVDKGINTLSEYRHARLYKAEPGAEGGKRKQHGKDGADLVLRVPEGTVIYDDATNKVICDMSGDNQRVVVLKGGRGGKGNMNYATPTMQAPKYAQPGGESIELTVRLELKCIADVGLVGFPNAGKSTLLSRCSNAKPKIANYQFTTLQPMLGVVDLPGANGFVMADIPGLIEGASEGIGLGHQFLRHIERTKVLLHVVDAAATEGRDPMEDVEIINKELTEFHRGLENKPKIIVANKVDSIYTPEGEKDIVTRLKEKYEPQGIGVYAISGVTGQGIKELLYACSKMVEENKDISSFFSSEMDPMEELAKEAAAIDVLKLEDHVFEISGARVDKMLGYTNLEDEKGFAFFQRFMKDNGILDRLVELGVEDGDTVEVGGFAFEYYK